MAKKTVPAKEKEEAQPSLQELQEQMHKQQQEEHKVAEQIARLQAEMSRTQGQGRRRAEINRSSALPALQLQQRRLRAEIFRLEQNVRTAREQAEKKE
jgi:hypothetical protein